MSTAPRRFVVGPVDSVPPGRPRRVEVDGRPVAIFNVDGTFYALRDICPHRGAALSGGVVVGAISASGPGEYSFDPDRAYVRCPWHGWEYDLASGQSWCDAKSRVKAYEVSVESGAEVLDPDGRLPGPYVAETVPISIENDYIVIEA